MKRIFLNTSIWICSLFTLAACGGTPPSVAPAPALVTVGPGETSANNVTIRLDSATIIEDDGDNGTGGEPFFAILAIRRDQANVRSAKLLLPGRGSFADVVAGDTINLGDFSLQLNGLSDEEEVTLFFLGLEADEPVPESVTADFAVDALLSVLVDTTVDLLVPGGDLVRIAVSSLTGPALDWWQETDSLGDYQLNLSAGNDDLIGRQTQATAANGNVLFTFTILRSTERVETAENTGTSAVNMTVINRSDQPLTRVYIAPVQESIFDHPFSVMILPDHVQGFAVAPGMYNLRAESDTGFYWEVAGLEVDSSRSWLVSD